VEVDGNGDVVSAEGDGNDDAEGIVFLPGDGLPGFNAATTHLQVDKVCAVLWGAVVIC
jgi:hypothetical protein